MSRKSPSTPITKRPSPPCGKKPLFDLNRDSDLFKINRSLSLFILLIFFASSPRAETVKTVSGRIREIHPEKNEAVLSFQNPVKGQIEELILAVDSGTGFSEGTTFQDLQPGEAVSADYEERKDKLPRALQIKEIPLTGVPFDKVPSFLSDSRGKESARVHFFHGLKLKSEGKLLAAERLFRKTIEIEPENPDYHFELGNLYLEQNAVLEAQSEYNQALMINPGHLASHFNLGLSYRIREMMPEARNEFKRVLELDPHFVKAQIQIGRTYQAEGFIQEARQAYESAKALDYSSSEPRDALENLEAAEERAKSRERLEMEESVFATQEMVRRANQEN